MEVKFSRFHDECNVERRHDEERFRNLVLHKITCRAIVASDQPHASQTARHLSYTLSHTSLTPTPYGQSQQSLLNGQPDRRSRAALHPQRHRRHGHPPRHQPLLCGRQQRTPGGNHLCGRHPLEPPGGSSRQLPQQGPRSLCGRTPATGLLGRQGLRTEAHQAARDR